ncbi:hypothetical protein NDNC_0430 [Candidatus Nasuia deltocephalinicola]|uniref:S1 motif domain-containing protein n=1 Tax=Candidatus Nasuia deltocephalincola TaxID=1160784 RepID=A0A975A376_9PROT|nr:hypothetical protein CU086_00710 [Candidatus Nasuia deltocephalinicola]BEH03877.1 hypothetical protein NDNC_0430 [Candidatus Nasuia deltocephalinicola]
MLNNNNFNLFLNKKNIINNIYKNNILFLKVLQIKKKYLIFDGNLKSECFIKISEFLKNSFLEIKEKDYVEVFLKNYENSFGKITVSRFKFLNYIFWKNIFFNWKNKIFIKGSILNRIKGGYFVLIKNFKCFLPFSCSDKKISNTQYYFNKNIYFLILNFNYLKKNIILSRKFVILKIFNLKKKIFFKKIFIGCIIKGIIKNITSYCMFIDTGYVDCICFFRNLTWGNYRYFNELFKIGQSILGIILKIDKKNFRIFLGIKQLFNPWNKINFLKNHIKYVRIIRINNNNIYIVICKNIISSISNFFNKKKNKYFKINNYLKIILNNFNFKRKRINCKIKFYKNYSSLSSIG